MTSLTAKIVALLLAVGLIFGVGVWAGRRYWTPKTNVEKPAAAVVLLDGSVMLARDAGAGAKPAQTIPPEAKVVRIIKVVVKPGEPAQPGTSGTAPQDGGTSTAPSTQTNPCPPVRVDLTLVKMPDGTQRVIASSPDGKIDGAASVDIPVAEPTAPAKAYTWGLGCVIGAGDNGATSKGIVYHHKVIGPVWAAAEITKDTYGNSTSGWSGRLQVSVFF